MNKILKAAAIAVAISGVSAISLGTAFAADPPVVTFDPNGVAYGYQDGYWTKTHEWHAWDQPEHVQIYQKVPNAQYHDWVHTRDPDQGWVVIQKSQ